MTSGKNFSTLTKWLAPVDVTAKAGLKAMKKRELLAVPGFMNQLGLFAFRAQRTTEWSLLMAASTLVTLPLVVIFFFAQRYFLEGIKLTGIKG